MADFDAEENDDSRVVYDARLYYYRQWAQLSAAVKEAMIRGDLPVWLRASMSMHNHVAPFMGKPESEKIAALLETARSKAAALFARRERGPQFDQSRGVLFGEVEQALLEAERLTMAELAAKNMLLPRSAGEAEGRDLDGWTRQGG